MYSNRGNFLAGLPQVTKVILIINIAIFAFVTFTGALVYTPGVYRSIADVPIGIRIWDFLALKSFHTGAFKPYQLITHMFNHGLFRYGGGMHIIFNMYFGLYMFGRYLEQSLGSKRFFILYFISGLGAAGLQLAVNYLQEEPSSMVGASGAIMGVFAAFAVKFPDVKLQLLFIPVPIKAKYMLPIMAVLSIVLGVTGGGGLFGNVAHFAHIGGAVAGFLLVWFWKKKQFNKNLY